MLGFRVELLELILHLHQFAADALEARHDVLSVYYLLLARLEAFAGSFDGKPLLLHQVVDEADEVDVLLGVLAYACRGFLGA